MSNSLIVIGDGVHLGITVRLVIAFTGVAVLAVAANFLAEQGVLIERTTQITRTVPAPMTAQTLPPVAQATPATIAVAPKRRTASSDSLLLALDRFSQEVHERLDTKGEPAEARYQRTRIELDRTADSFLTTATTISGRSFVKVSVAIKAYEKRGSEIVAAADNRRALVSTYAARIETLDTRGKNSLTGSWKIFGRVVARQSLMQLSADLDTFRRHATAFSSDVDGDSEARDQLLAAERVIQKDFDNYGAGLRHSEGDTWYNAMRSDFATLVALRESIVQADEEIHELSGNFAQQSNLLSKMIPRTVEEPLKTEPPIVQSRNPEVTASVLGSTAFVSISPAAAPATVETHSVKTESPSDRTRRRELAWISLAVLALLIYVAVGTVLSITRPVQRLLKATAQLARGDSDVQVPRGGIKELDSVAVAFNSMAAELSLAKATARGYQQSLEAKVTERTRQLKDLAEHDPLTGLPNRRELFVLLNAALARAHAAGHQLGVFFLDVDNFKYINDSMGHAYGDRVLVALAERLQATVSPFGFAARLGGDEFTVVFDRDENTDVIRTAGIGIVQAFQKPLAVDGRDLIVSVSVGASIYPDHAQDAQALLKAADAALFRAKSMGRSQLSVFTPELLEAAAAKFTTEQGLRRAVERGEFELLFQPEISAETLETSLVEALIRWRMPDGSLASPGAFLAIAEESGLIMEISDWVLRTAIEAAAHWHHGLWPEVRVAINVTPRQLVDAGFLDRLHGLLEAFSLPTRCIELELTESVLQTGPATIEALRRLRVDGVAIALDDFGTGYSSLASLEQLPLTRIKLDRSLIAAIDKNPRSAAIAQAIIAMCQGLGLEITAEGIERPAQFALLQKHRGMYLQGYLLAHPTSRDDVIPVMTRAARQCQDLFLSSQATTHMDAAASPRPQLRVLSGIG